MKIFDSTNSPWMSKVNFIDENNVGVGYDLSQCCCEYAGWFISDKPEDVILGYQPRDLEYIILGYQPSDLEDCQFDTKYQPRDLEDWRFDPSYFSVAAEAKGLDCGGMVRFRLVSNDGREKFLHLFNVHNGYYAHGFEMSVGGQVVRTGDI